MDFFHLGEILYSIQGYIGGLNGSVHLCLLWWVPITKGSCGEAGENGCHANYEHEHQAQGVLRISLDRDGVRLPLSVGLFHFATTLLP